MPARVFLLSCLLVGCASAQFDSSASKLASPVRVHVVLSKGEVCDPTIRVLLVSINGTVDEGSINERCVAEFQSVAPGTYRVTVSGRDIPPVDTNAVFDSASARDLEIKITSARSGGSGGGAFVRAADLRIPPNARREYEKANQLIAKREWGKAVSRFEKVIAIYPEYAAAYNGLAVAYSQLGDGEREREALLKAIQLNDHFASAYLNLGRMDILTGDFRNAETALGRASDLDPANTMTLVLLALAEFQNHHYPEAVATARKAHAAPQAPHASVHLIAARAWEQQNRPADAGSELRLFLAEDPNGPKSAAARKELASLHTSPQ